MYIVVVLFNNSVHHVRPLRISGRSFCFLGFASVEVTSRVALQCGEWQVLVLFCEQRSYICDPDHHRSPSRRLLLHRPYRYRYRYRYPHSYSCVYVQFSLSQRL